MKKAIFLSVVVPFGVLVFAAGFANAQSPSEPQFIERDIQSEASKAEVARKRLYPGGRDEEDLKVQQTLIPPTRRLDVKGLQAQVLKGKVRIEVDSENEPASGSAE